MSFGTGGRITADFRDLLARHFASGKETWTGNYSVDSREKIERVIRNLSRYGYWGELGSFDWPHPGLILTIERLSLVEREVGIPVRKLVPKSQVRSTDNVLRF